MDLNLRSGKNKHDDIILNLSTNFHEKVITRNTRSNGEWGIEERDEHLYEREDESLNPIVAGTAVIIDPNDKIIANSFLLCRRSFQTLYSNM